jgi:hypothetical protein
MLPEMPSLAHGAILAHVAAPTGESFANGSRKLELQRKRVHRERASGKSQKSSQQVGARAND